MQSRVSRPFSRRALLASALAATLIAGGTWRTFAADHGAVVAPVASAPEAPSGRASLPRRDSYADVVRTVAPSVVTIRVESTRTAPTSGPDDFFGQFFGRGNGPSGPPRRFRQQGLGSGVIVGSDGYILTNHHVVDAASDIRVDLEDGRSLPATVVGADEPSDLAVIKVKATGLPAIRFGDSDAVEVGDLALAVGNPLGVGQTVTMGIISAKGRSTGVGDGSYEDFIQTDAPINHGNSGGALVNVDGALIGINAQMLSNSDGSIGIGFAIPAKMAQHVMEALKTNGRVRRGQLGVTAQPVTSDIAASLNLPSAGGVIVAEVAADSAAERAGVHQGDVIVAVDGTSIRDSNALRNRVADTAPGTTVRLQVVRDGKPREVSATLSEVPSRQARAGDDDSATADHAGGLGIAVAPVTRALARQQGWPATVSGVVVESVNDGSRAARAGLQPGDIIESVNQQPVRDVDGLRTAVRGTSGRPLLLLVRRDGRELFLTASEA